MQFQSSKTALMRATLKIIIEDLFEFIEKKLLICKQAFVIN